MFMKESINEILDFSNVRSRDMIKLIATDMDGTLLNSNNQIQEGFYEVFNELQEKDIIFAAASGRQYYNLLERFK